MDLVFDISQVNQFVDVNPFVLMWNIFTSGGWIIIAAILIWGGWQVFRFKMNLRWWSKQKFTVLAIDVPKDTVQGPRAVENIFSVFAGMHGSMNKFEEYIENADQLYITLELVSIEGYIQFLIPISLYYTISIN